MVCQNCHSDQIIAVQDQHFCINCGQMVPEELGASRQHKPHVQPNGLPEGVTILPLSPDAVQPGNNPLEESTTNSSAIINDRTRLGSPEETIVKRRKVGRPKKGRLDVAKIIENVVPRELPPSPIVATPISSKSADHRLGTIPPKRMDDIARRQHPNHQQNEARHVGSARKSEDAAPLGKSKPKKHSRSRIHKVGVPALHYGPVIAFSLRARAQPRLVALAALGTGSIGIAGAYGVWVLRNQGIDSLANTLMHSGISVLIEVVLLALIYYVGRSIGQSAIVYGIAREADARPVTLSRQLGIGINTFGRRLALDLGFAFGEAVLLACGVALFLGGGTQWPVTLNLQLGIVFATYLAILYLLAALALSRGLAEITLTLTNLSPRRAARVGWQLFSHRIELIGPRFGALLMEFSLAVPLAALVVALVVASPPSYHLGVAIGAGFLAWLGGALIGVGTAAWWTALYRQLVIADRPSEVAGLLSGRQPENAKSLPLAVIVAISTLLIAASIALPWIRLA